MNSIPVSRIDVDAASVPVSSLLATVAIELESMRSLGLRIEASFCALAAEAPITAAWMEDLQQFDFVLQQLAVLRDFLGAAAGAEGSGAHIDLGGALHRIPLQGLRSRLHGEIVGEEANGEVILFDEVGRE